jgi:hypothetical protein
VSASLLGGEAIPAKLEGQAAHEEAAAFADHCRSRLRRDRAESGSISLFPLSCVIAVALLPLSTPNLFSRRLIIFMAARGLVEYAATSMRGFDLRRKYLRILVLSI